MPDYFDHLTDNEDDELLQLEDELEDEPVVTETAARSRTTFFWVRWICRRPKTMFAVTFTFHIAMIVITTILAVSGFDILHLVVKGMPVYDMTDIMYKRFLALTQKDSDGGFIITITDMYPARKRRSIPDVNFDPSLHHLQNAESQREWNNGLSFPTLHMDVGYSDFGFGGSEQTNLYAQQPALSNFTLSHKGRKLFHPSDSRHRTKRSPDYGCGKHYNMSQRFNLIYNVGDRSGNILTPKYLKIIRHFETELMRDLLVRTHYRGFGICYCPESGKGSVLDLFESDLIHLRNGITTDFFLGKTGNIDQSRKPYSWITRSYYRFCTYGRWANDPFYSWGHEVLYSRADELSEEILKPAGIELSYFVYNVYSDKIVKTVFQDLYLFLGSVLFIFAFMWLQTGSLWITFFGIFSIIASIVSSNIIYNCVIGFKYVSIFNLLSLFVVLGIGADDIFIFVDTWKWLEDKCATSEERMTMCYKKAGVAMFSTSLTTMVAFFVSSFSSLLALSSFGTLSGIVVLINYISVIIFFPTVILTYEDLFVKTTNKRCSTLSAIFAKSNNCMKGIHENVLNFFGGLFHDIVTHKYGRWALVIAFSLLTAGMGFSCADLRVRDTASPQVLRINSPFEQGRIKATKEFKRNIDEVKEQVFLVWGMKPRDMSHCNRLRYDYMKPCPGKGVLDNGFKLESPEAQMAMLHLCQSFSNIHGALETELGLTRDGSSKKVNLYCVMEYFNQYLHEVSKKAGKDISLPVTKEKLKPLVSLLKFGGVADLDLEKIETPFQTMLWIFIYRSDHDHDLQKLVEFHSLTEEDKKHSVGTYKGETIYNRRLKFFSIMIPTSKSVMKLGITNGLEMMKHWERFASGKVSKLPDGLKGGFQVARSWFLINMKEGLVKNALTGIGVSLVLGFTLLLLTTRNIILAGISLLTLTATVVCVIGIMPLLDWTLGPLVALNICFVAGLAVDYIVHVVEGFQLSDYRKRQERIKDCLRHVGISILSGAVTTLGSSFFMLFAKVNFFMQFGSFIFCTIGTSLIFSLFFLPALLSLIGPNGNYGSIMNLCKRKNAMHSNGWVTDRL